MLGSKLGGGNRTCLQGIWGLFMDLGWLEVQVSANKLSLSRTIRLWLEASWQTLQSVTLVSSNPSVRPAFELSYSSKRCNGCLRWPSDCLYGSLAARHYAGSLGTLSKDGDDGSENVGKKMNFRSFKVNHVFWPVQYVKKMQAPFCWSWILKDFIQVQQEEGKFVVVCPHPP